MSIIIRPATAEDKEFIITSVIEAEKSGSDVVSYCAIFSITEEEFKELLGEILDEGIEGHELYIPNFLIAEMDNEKAATISTWLEKENGIASNIIKSNLLLFFLDRDKILNATPSLSLMNEVNITREEKTLQLECVYTVPKFRGHGLTRQLIDEAIKLKQEAGFTFNKVQVIVLKNNQNALNAYRKAGFTIIQEKQCTDKAILSLLPCDTKVLMERKIYTE